METKEKKEKAAAASEGQSEKYSYEELSRIAAELSRQNGELRRWADGARRQMDMMQTDNVFRYLECLFRVLGSPAMYDDGFIDSCASDVRTLMGLLHSLAVPPEDGGEEDGDGGEAVSEAGEAGGEA